MFKKRNLIFICLLILGVFLITGCFLISASTYTVTYDGNGHTGGSIPTDSTVYEENDTVTVLDKGDLVKTGYTFAGWNTAADGSGTDHAVGSTFIMGAAEVTLFAQWTTNTYTVTFNSQGGSAVDPQTVELGGKVTKPTNPTRTGYAFAGWYKESGCTNAWDFATDTVISNVTLYAKWTTNSYTVTFNGNGSTGGTAPTDSNNYDYGVTVTVLGNTGSLVKTGYTFAGWNTQADGSGTDQAEGSTFTMGAADVTLYAKWATNTYTVTFNSQGGSAVSLQTVNHGGKVSEPTDPTKTDYTFAGWYKESGCTNAWDFATDTVTSNVTLYAKWTPLYALRDTGPAGGLIFYVKDGGYSDGWMFLEAAPSDQSDGTQWGSYGSLIGGTETGIGNGQSNTTTIVTWLNNNSETDRAAQLCDILTEGAYSDWFLPSKDELNLMYTNLKDAGVGGFTTWYWSSSEFNADNVYVQYFVSGGQGTQPKNATSIRVRAVRAF